MKYSNDFIFVIYLKLKSQSTYVIVLISDGAKQYQQTNSNSQGDELNYRIPSYQIQQPTVELDNPSTDESSSPIQIPFHPPKEQQLANLIWMGDNIRDQNNKGK